MTNTIDFYFDFSSSYSYLAQAQVAEIEQQTGKSVSLTPILLGAVFHALEHSVPDKDSVKMKYFNMDLLRAATHVGLPFALPPVFPFNAIEAMRLYYLLEARDPSVALVFASKVFAAAYAHQKDMSNAEQLESLLSEMQLDREQLLASDEFVLAKTKLKQQTQKAIEAGVFGAPTFVYQGERFWGADRIGLLIEKAST